MGRQDTIVSLAIVVSVVVALFFPGAFLWVGPSLTTALLGTLAFAMGTTARTDDLRACLRRPRPVLINFAGCFLLVPAIAAVLGRMLGLPRSHLVGLVMVGCVNGGAGSNLLTLLAGGDVALSVLMTASTTMGAAFATPAVAKLWVGTVVPVDAFGILLSALRLVLAPTGLGLATSWAAPSLCVACAPWLPFVALLCVVPLLGSTVARSAQQVWAGDSGLHVAVLAWLALAGLAGYGLSALTAGGERERRAVAIEFACKNIVLAGVLLREHFGDPETQVPVAAFAFWASLLCAVVAAIWGRQPVREKARDVDGADEWCAAYGA